MYDQVTRLSTFIFPHKNCCDCYCLLSVSSSLSSFSIAQHVKHDNRSQIRVHKDELYKPTRQKTSQNVCIHNSAVVLISTLNCNGFTLTNCYAFLCFLQNNDACATALFKNRIYNIRYKTFNSPYWYPWLTLSLSWVKNV